MPKNKVPKSVECAFDVSSGEMRRIVNDFHAEMRRGLRGQKSSLKMIPTYVRRPQGSEKGVFLGLDLGGTNFRISALELKGKRKVGKPLLRNVVLKARHVKGSGEYLFDFLAGSLRDFMIEHGMAPEDKHKVGFTFSFPVRQERIDSGILVTWTKGFSARGVVGKDVVLLLNNAMKRKGLAKTRVYAVANDTVSTLVAASYENRDCDIGVILGTGTNACYSEKNMLINIEWGNFNKLRSTRYDKELDRRSGNPGKQVLEKMVSGLYLGEIAKLVVKDLTGKTLKGFRTEHMSAIENDNSKNLSRTDRLLRKLHFPQADYGNRELIKKICGMISKRSARLSAAAIASVITRIDPRLLRKHTVAIDGSVYEKYHGFSRKIKTALVELLKRKADNIRIELTKDGSSKGAAIIAAINSGVKWK